MGAHLYLAGAGGVNCPSTQHGFFFNGSSSVSVAGVIAVLAKVV